MQATVGKRWFSPGEGNLNLVIKSKLQFKFSLGPYLQCLETLGTKTWEEGAQ